jgi:hypothetical protein
MLDKEHSTPIPTPPYLNPQRVDVEHLDGDRLRVSVTFAMPPRTDPKEIQLPDGDTRPVPGNALYLFVITTAEGDSGGILITSPASPELPWSASRINTDMPAPDGGSIPVTVSSTGRVVSMVVNLANHDQLMKQIPFKPQIEVTSMISSARQGKAAYVGNFMCGWDALTPTTAESSPVPMQPPISLPTAQASEPLFPPDSKPCPPKYGVTGAFVRSAVGNDQTSCPFAEEVRISYADMGSPPSAQELKVFSPVTQQMYDIACQPTGRFITCTGGNGAVVYLG